MAHPKRKISKSRRDKRRTHYKATAPSLWLDKESGVVHLPHRAYNVDGNLYLRGKLLVENTSIA
ncbi:50S ribosomal protein L32 [Pedobacter alpinus]|uniref:Large ribosomal subunit protein bL32 n=1 Tax=Pedobacter alpinus TaxID=1590643 RepID=A0ABW5TQH2_9SPHI